MLNAKQHEREASIVAQAGQRGAVTIATNMAGRGTDIMLGFGVAELGGLHIIGTERHESRRIDNQLRGRAGRQGDHGSIALLCLDRRRDHAPLGRQPEHRQLAPASRPVGRGYAHRALHARKSVEQAQVKMEGFNFDMRKHLVEYDDVVNTQRDVIYGERRFILKDGDPRSIVSEMIGEKVQDSPSPAPWMKPRASARRRRKPRVIHEMFGALKETFPDDIVRRAPALYPDLTHCSPRGRRRPRRLQAETGANRTGSI